MVILSILLNLYWFRLMAAMIGRVIGRIFAGGKETSEQAEEKIELKNADSLKQGDNVIE